MRRPRVTLAGVMVLVCFAAVVSSALFAPSGLTVLLMVSLGMILAFVMGRDRGGR